MTHVSRLARASLLAATILALAFAVPAVASASTLTLTSVPNSNMAPVCPGGYLVSMQNGDATPPATPPSCGLSTMGTTASSVTGVFSSPAAGGSVVVSAYINTGSRVTTLTLLVNGQPLGSPITATANTRQWWSFPSVDVLASDALQVKVSLGTGSTSTVSSLHAEFTPHATTDLGSLIHSDMNTPHQLLPEGVPSFWNWYSSPVVTDAADMHGYGFADPWGQVYIASNGNSQLGPNGETMWVDYRNINAWVLRRSTNTWTPLYTNNGGYGFTPAPTVTASSQSGCSIAAKVIDGLSLGSPTYPCNEWATAGGGAGSWLNLAWSAPQTLTKVVLYDRPNLSDQITGGNLVFSDGTTVPVPALNNDGTATTVTFPPVTTSTVEFDVTSVSATTQNAGLSEIQPMAAVEPTLGGALYPEDFSSGSIGGNFTRLSAQEVKVAPKCAACAPTTAKGYLFHLYPDQGRASVNASDVAAACSSADVRLDPSDPLTPYQPGLIANVGFDWWSASGGGAANGAGESQFKTVGRSWRELAFCTTTASQQATAPLPPITADSSELF